MLWFDTDLGDEYMDYLFTGERTWENFNLWNVVSVPDIWGHVQENVHLSSRRPAVVCHRNVARSDREREREREREQLHDMHHMVPRKSPTIYM